MMSCERASQCTAASPYHMGWDTWVVTAASTDLSACLALILFLLQEHGQLAVGIDSGW